MNLSEAIQVRRSVRTFDPAPVDPALLGALREYAAHAPSPFERDRDFGITLIDRRAGGRLGTYGVISGAAHFLVLTARPDCPASLMAAGYAMEHVILRATALGLGTCWLGGTFRAADFMRGSAPGDGMKIVCVSPVGIPAEKQGLKAGLMRMIARSDSRKPFADLFFAGDFRHPYPADGPLADAFRAVRLAPSASNCQPWRCVTRPDGTRVDFFAARDPGFRHIDTGIAMAHFDLALGLHHRWREGGADAPKGLAYCVTKFL